MIPLLIAVLCTTAFSLIVRGTQRAGLDQLAVMALNYSTASASAFLLSGGGAITPMTWQVGAASGLVYVTAYILFMHAMHRRGVAITNAVTRLSVLVPVTGTIIIFREQPHLWEIIGALLAISAMPLLSLDRGFSNAPLTSRQLALLVGLFVVNGLCMFSSKWFQALGVPEQRPMFLGFLFGTAALASIVAWGMGSRRLGWRELVWGVPLGVINFGTSYMIIAALDQLAGTIVFPAVAALGLVGTAGMAAWLWREVPGRLGQVGLAVALVAVVLINI